MTVYDMRDMVRNAIAAIECYDRCKAKNDASFWYRIKDNLQRVDGALTRAVDKFGDEYIYGVFSTLLPDTFWKELSVLIQYGSCEIVIPEVLDDAVHVLCATLLKPKTDAMLSMVRTFSDMVYGPTDDIASDIDLIPGEAVSHEQGVSFGHTPPPWYTQEEVRLLNLEQVQNGEWIEQNNTEEQYAKEDSITDNASTKPVLQPISSDEQCFALYSKLRVEIAYLLGRNEGSKKNRVLRHQLEATVLSIKNRMRIAYHHLPVDEQLAIYALLTTVLWNISIGTKKELEHAISQLDIVYGKVYEAVQHLISNWESEG